MAELAVFKASVFKGTVFNTGGAEATPGFDRYFELKREQIIALQKAERLLEEQKQKEAIDLLERQEEEVLDLAVSKWQAQEITLQALLSEIVKLRLELIAQEEMMALQRARDLDDEAAFLLMLH